MSSLLKPPSTLKANKQLGRNSLGDPFLSLHSSEKVKTKIICTIGPACKSKEMLFRLLDAGMSVARLNFSHGTHEYHAETIKNLRTCLAETNRIAAIMLDTKGPEIRSGKLEGGQPVQLEAGQSFTFYTEPILGNASQVSVTYKALPKTVKPGDHILVDDGLLSFTVLRCSASSVECTIDNSGRLGETKGVNLPGLVVDLPAVTDKDKEDIQFGVDQSVDFIAASFIRKAEDVEEIRNLPGVRENGIKIIAKIESQEGIKNFEEILEVSDGIMVARGDLGVEIPIEQVCIYQKMMIRRSNDVGKPVITATQMLESMTNNPRPTRAEATDVANAVFDGTDCVMLSGETANGKYPVETVQMMSRICREAEKQIDYRSLYLKMRADTKFPQSTSDSIASSAVKSSWDVQANLIVAISETGNMIRLIAKYRPHTMILCITKHFRSAAQAMLSRATIAYLVESDDFNCGDDVVIRNALEVCKNDGVVVVGQKVVITSGLVEGVSGSTNMLKIISVAP